ncbi:hypothetical protein [Pseudarthrobacter cellobiosi]|uniref:hypothetical protein n=1 Tax=Pseudarthrobacter cellobiosi TaxID=2953654 RepID=UPI00208ECB00|nr:MULTISPECIES: hypothetical protein [unclassified Pseudarthrobacter]MCO4254073.1 hypothetical protein [Pseudarthrobacter sp. HLT1-5]MCO4273077.1 hypothetical protein [Pseudarthrobacter sp. HLT3-5]
MTRNERLAVWLHGRRIAWLTGTSLRPRLEYLPDLVAEYGAGAALLSLSLPLQSKAINGPAGRLAAGGWTSRKPAPA